MWLLAEGLFRGLAVPPVVLIQIQHLEKRGLAQAELAPLFLHAVELEDDGATLQDLEITKDRYM